MTFEEEFFILAGMMLQCLWHEVNVPGDKVFNCIGVLDNSSEMWMLIQQQKLRRKEWLRQKRNKDHG